MTSTENSIDLKSFCRNLDCIYAELLDQNVALESMVELIRQEDVTMGVSILLRNIKDNISEQLENLTDADNDLRRNIGMEGA